jgi:hypothetical protein
VLRVPTYLPVRSHVCGIEAHPLAPLLMGAGAFGVPAVSAVHRAFMAGGTSTK